MNGGARAHYVLSFKPWANHHACAHCRSPTGTKISNRGVENPASASKIYLFQEPNDERTARTSFDHNRPTFAPVSSPVFWTWTRQKFQRSIESRAAAGNRLNSEEGSGELLQRESFAGRDRPV